MRGFLYMFFKWTSMIRCFIICISFTLVTCGSYVNKLQEEPHKVRFYPKKSVFEKSDLIDKGCTVFLTECPNIYKQNKICGRHYDGYYKTFINYCEMEFENCNGWRQWTMVKKTPC